MHQSQALNKGSVWGFSELKRWLWYNLWLFIYKDEANCYVPLLGKSPVQQLVLTEFGDVTLSKLLTLRVNVEEKSSQILEKYMNIAALASRLLKQNWCNLSHFWETVVIWWSGWVGTKLHKFRQKQKPTERMTHLDSEYWK